MENSRPRQHENPARKSGFSLHKKSFFIPSHVPPPASHRVLSRPCGFTLIEVLIVVAVTAIIGGLVVTQISSTQKAAAAGKLNSDVQTLNSAVVLYQTFGGAIATNDTADTVLAKLKTRRTTASANTSSGLTGSFIDARISPVWQNRNEASTSQNRAVWDGTRFVVLASGDAGIKKFVLDDSLSGAALTTESGRTDFLLASDRTSTTPKWIWDFQNSVAQNSFSAPVDYSGLTGSYLTPVALAQGFESGYWTVGDSGDIDVSYVFREAGYDSRLALFSLEGMGPDVYDLDTEAGQQAFLAEALRRVVEGDRAQVIIDASQSSVGYGHTYSFRPGDTVAAITIPNASFETAYQEFQDGDASSQQSPLTSLSREGGNDAPFYANQYATLGSGTSAYAIEDISSQGSSDNDYQDLMFKANGMTQAQSSSTYTIQDPIGFYRNDPFWVHGPDGSPGLYTQLMLAGIIPQGTPLFGEDGPPHDDDFYEGGVEL